MEKIMNSAVCLLERAALRSAAKTAFEDADGEISYGELRDKSRAAGSALIKRGMSGKPVIVYLPKGIGSVIAFEGALYSASPYAPVDYKIPLKRLKTIAENIHPSAVITDSDGAERLKNFGIEAPALTLDSLLSEPCDNAAVNKALSRVCDTDPVHIIHTSGSTGAPKGVTITHRNLLDLVNWFYNTFDFGENDVYGIGLPFHFDSAVTDIYTAICARCKAVIIPEALFMFPERLTEYIKEKEITCTKSIPTVMGKIANSGILEKIALPNLRLVLFGAEVMPNKQLNIWRKNLPQCIYANLYGPTECTDVCVYYKPARDFGDGEVLPIGVPRPNVRIYIITEDGGEADVNEPGELCISGTCVSAGYYNAKALTDAAFVQNPLNGSYNERIYRTGDIAYKTEDGLIMFAGRGDSQVKVRGNRIELGEIETAASVIDGVESVCALFDAAKEEIVLFIETKQEINARRFRMRLGERVPNYMLPGRIVALESFPHTPNGKVDRAGLKDKYIIGGKEEK